MVYPTIKSNAPSQKAAIICNTDGNRVNNDSHLLLVNFNNLVEVDAASGRQGKKKKKKGKKKNVIPR